MTAPANPTPEKTPRCDTFRQNYDPLTIESCMAFAEQLEQECAELERSLKTVSIAFIRHTKKLVDWNALFREAAASRITGPFVPTLPPL